MTDTVNVPRKKLEEVRDVLAERIQGSTARSPSHNARVLIDAVLEAAPKAEPVSETVRLSLETANYLERIAEEADDNQWQDWAATMRQASGQMRLLCSAQPEAPKVEQEPVAWLVGEGGGTIMTRAAAWVEGKRSQGVSVVPLYTHPAPASDELLEALKLYDVWAAIPQDRGGKGGTKGCALEAFLTAKDAAIAKHKGPQS